MKNVVKFNDVEDRIISLHHAQVLLDCDVADLYGVATKRINEAVKNNPDKFPEGYFFEVTVEELKSLRSKNSTLKTGERGQHTKYVPKVFTEKGLYMLATILKSERATQTTIAIVETFARIRELARNITQIPDTLDEQTQNQLMQRSGKIVADLLDEELQTTGTETSIELNLAVLKFKHTIKREKE